MYKITMYNHQGSWFYFQRHKFFQIIGWGRAIKMSTIFISSHSSYQTLWHKTLKQNIEDNKTLDSSTFQKKIFRIKQQLGKRLTFMWSWNCPEATIVNCCIFKCKPQTCACSRFRVKECTILVWHHLTTNTWLLQERKYPKREPINWISCQKKKRRACRIYLEDVHRLHNCRPLVA